MSTITDTITDTIISRLLVADAGNTCDDATLRWLAELLESAARHSRSASMLLLEVDVLRAAIGTEPASDQRVMATVRARTRLKSMLSDLRLGLPVYRE